MKRIKLMFAAVITLTTVSQILCAQTVLSHEDYLSPPKEIKDVVMAPRWNNHTLSQLSPDNQTYVIGDSKSITQISQMAKPFYNLAEIEIDYKANRHRDFTINLLLPEKDNKKSVIFNTFYLYNCKTSQKTSIQTPALAYVSNPFFSPDGSMVAYFAHFDDATHIYIADTKTGTSRKLTTTPVLATHVTSFQWTADSKNILTVLLPENRSVAPVEPNIPTSPKVRLTNEGFNPIRTYGHLLKNQHDKDLLEYYSTGQLALINTETSQAKNIGDPDMFLTASISPDGKFVRVKILQKPFSYIVPLKMFASVEQLWNLNGKSLVDLIKTPLSLIDDESKNSIQKYKDSPKPKKNEKAERYLQWAPDGKGLIFLQQKKIKKGKTGNDQLVRWIPPFEPNNTEVLYQQKDKMDDNVIFSRDMTFAFLCETKEKDKTKKLFTVKLADPKKKYTITKSKTDDFYNDPGQLLTKSDSRGQFAVVSSDNKYVYLQGTKYYKDFHKNPPRPFVDKVAIENSSEKTRIFKSPTDKFEEFSNALDRDLNFFVTTCQSPCEIENSFLHDRLAGSQKKLTDNIDYSPQITNCQRKRVLTQNPDGYKFWVTVTLPVNYSSDQKPPAMIWFYPRDYTSQKEFDEKVTRLYNRNLFQGINSVNSNKDGIRSMNILTTQGYTCVKPDFPYFGIGNNKVVNDYFIPELRNNLWSIIETLDKLGYIDRDRLAIGGHSFGAFSTLHAMINTPFFKAGIAGDGNYNRTLTPSGWQHERRQLWSARETHVRLSAMIQAEKLHGAILLYHGADDENVGCSPVHSANLFAVLNNLGKTAAYYEYPYEHHSPITEQSILDLWARWIPWLDMHVKNPQKLSAGKDITQDPNDLEKAIQ